MPVTIDGSNGITQAGEFNSDSTFGFKNRIINGAMVIDQRNAGASVSVSSNTYTIDRYRSLCGGGSGAYSVQQSSTAPAGFTKSMLMTVTTTVSSPASNAYFAMRQSIEGYNIADLNQGSANAKTFTVSFWVRSSVTGTFGGSVDNDVDRSYPFTFTISSANTWEQKTVTITGCTDGTWNTTNGIGLNLQIAIGAGSSFSGTANAWASGTYFSVTGATNLMATNGATFYITGVQLEVGSAATNFDVRSYGTELALCQRYALVLGGSSFENIGLGVVTSSTNVNMPIILPVDMRASPSVSFSGTIYMNTSGLQTVTAMATNNASVRMPNFTITSSGMTTGTFLLLSANGKMTLNAEL